jgi:hypothetical protein
MISNIEAKGVQVAHLSTDEINATSSEKTILLQIMMVRDDAEKKINVPR